MAKTGTAIRFPVRGRAKSELERIGKKRWLAMQRVATALRELGDAPLTLQVATKMATKFGVHSSTVYRYRSRLAESGELTTVFGRKRGRKASVPRLSEQQEAAIQSAIEFMRKKPGTLRIVDLVEEVERHCRMEQVSPPSRSTIDRRLKLAKRVRVKRRGTAMPGSADPASSPGTFLVRRPLEIVQIDHTTMDISVVDDLYRQPLGRPYLTLATDVATRCILGFVITFIPPSASTVSLCLTMVVSSKRPWLRHLGIDEDAWPMAGLPQALHLDRAAEFKSKALRRGCGQYGIKLIHRERPHYGGHVERLLGTKMNKLKALPGATGGSPKSRRAYDPDKHAAMTLTELEGWFTRQIVGRYHLDAHRGLRGGTPAGAWSTRPPSSAAPESIKRFRIAFLPSVSRSLRRDGLVFNHLRYWHPIFAQWLGRRDKLVIHYDPRNLSAVYVPYEKDFIEARYADLRQPAVSLWEALAGAKFLRDNGRKSINPAMLIRTIEEQRSLVDNAQKTTRKARRKPPSKPNRSHASIDPLLDQPEKDEADEIDWSIPAKANDGEIW